MLAKLLLTRLDATLLLDTPEDDLSWCLDFPSGKRS